MFGPAFVLLGLVQEYWQYFALQVVTRTVTATMIPPRVDYELTPLGESLAEPVIALAQWAQVHMGTIQKARAEYDERVAEAEMAGA